MSAENINTKIELPVEILHLPDRIVAVAMQCVRICSKSKHHCHPYRLPVEISMVMKY